MMCAWEAFIRLLPSRIQYDVDMHGKNNLQELRLRLGLPPELRFQNKSIFLDTCVTADDINFSINSASRYSPWCAQTAASGYITAQGGHRVGICGIAAINGQSVSSIAQPNSVCIRISRDYPGIAKKADPITGSVLIIGKPGSGKTTLLRDLIRRRSDFGAAAVSVVDEKMELFPLNENQFCFPTGKRTDILSGCKKDVGIYSVLRNMGPQIIAVDEITHNDDCTALIHAGWCGVDLYATAHAASLSDLYKRPVYRPLIHNKIFQTVLVLQPDKSWTAERMEV